MPSSATTEPSLARVAEAHRRHYPGADFGQLNEAYRVAEEAHRGQLRKSGDAYITHPVAVTEILAEYGLDTPTLAAALLHDTVEDTDVTLAQIEAKFGSEVALLIDGVTKLDRIQYSSPQEAQAATIRKMVVAMAQDVRVLLMKLADRLHNIRTVSALRLEKQQRVALGNPRRLRAARPSPRRPGDQARVRGSLLCDSRAGDLRRDRVEARRAGTRA